MLGTNCTCLKSQNVDLKSFCPALYIKSNEDYYNEALAKAGYSDKIVYLDKEKRLDCRNKVDKSGVLGKPGGHLNTYQNVG